MRKRFLDSRALAQMEEDVLCQTRTGFQDREWRWPLVVDELLKIVHFEGELVPLPGQFADFQRYAGIWFSQSAYTVLAVHRLWRTGHYIEAYTLLRQLYEVFVQIRYFHKRPDLLAVHLGRNRKDRVPFRRMFDEFSPGLYDGLYGFLATASHGGATLAFRAKFNETEMTAKTIVGVEFSSLLSESVLNLLSAVTLGFLNAFFLVFPGNVLDRDGEFSSDIADTRAWLLEVLTGPRIPAANLDFVAKLRRLVTPDEVSA